jgi:hypothetical protein
MSTISVTARTLASMPNPYVVKGIELPAGPTVVCASEGYGPVIAIDPVTWKVRMIADGPGGCLDITPVPDRNAVYLIGGSFVGYDFHRSGVYRLDVPGLGEPAPGTPVRLFDLPFAHRLQSFRNDDGVHLVAASIAQSKRDRDDWTRPGAVYVADLGDGLAIPERGAEPPAAAARAGIPEYIPVPLRPILGELHRNHGLTTLRNDDTDGTSWLYISGTEGTFRAAFPETNESTWEFHRVVDHEISELFFIDLDNDGIDELVTIEPFHGDRLAVYRMDEGIRRDGDGPPQAQCSLWLEKEIAFGHGLWTGMIGGVPSILVGNRSGHKNLEMIRVSSGRLVTETIAEGTGTAQIAVVPGDGTGTHRDFIVASNQEQAEIVLYTVTPR